MYMGFLTSSCTSKNLNGIKNLVLCFFLLFFLNTNSFSGTIEIKENDAMIRNIQSEFLVYADTNGLRFEEITALPLSDFQPNKKNVIVHTEATYWLRFNVHNRLEEAQHRVLNFNDPDFEEIELFTNDKHFSSGTQYPFSYRPIIHKNFVFDLNLEPKETKTIYVRLRSKFHSSFTTDLSTTSELMSYSLTEYLLLGIFYGVIFILCVYNVILFFTDKNKTYLYYVFYMLSCALFALNEDGLGFQFLWGRAPSVNVLMHHLAPLCLLLSYLLYAASFSELRKYALKKFKLLWLTFTLFVAYYVLHTIFFAASPLWFFLYIIPFAVCYVFVLQVSSNRHRTTFFFLLGNTIILLSFLVYLLRLLNLIPSGILPVYSFNFAFITEAVVLSMAVGQQVKGNIKSRELAQKAVIKGLEENEKLKDKVNRELENKVAERTKSLQQKSNELEQANLRLNDLQSQLYKMNEQLDMNNYRLQKEVRKSTQQMITAKELSFEEFCGVFPTKKSCLDFVFKAKWVDKPFVCKKCGSNDFKLKYEYDRICANCNTPHSLTSGTLFHAVKLELQKALFLAYLINLNATKYTVDQLSEMVQISRNSAWNFKKKVMAQKEQVQKRTNTDRVNIETLVVG